MFESLNLSYLIIIKWLKITVYFTKKDRCTSRLSVDIYKNRDFIWLHWYGFSTVWLLWCISRLLFIVKASSHWLPLYGFSTVCILWCISRFWYWYKHLSTLAALLWLLPSVSSLVYFETLFYCESLHTSCIYMASPQCEFSDVFQDSFLL